MREQRISIDGQYIAYRTSEGTGRALVLIHGNSSSARVWDSLLESPFGERFRAWHSTFPGTVDQHLPGTLRTTRPG